MLSSKIPIQRVHSRIALKYDPVLYPPYWISTAHQMRFKNFLTFLKMSVLYILYHMTHFYLIYPRLLVLFLNILLYITVVITSEISLLLAVVDID
jgi:hypothetical protein